MNRNLFAFSTALLSFAACVDRQPSATPASSVSPPSSAEAQPAAAVPALSPPAVAEETPAKEPSPAASSTAGSTPIRLSGGMSPPRRLSGEMGAVATLSGSGKYSWSTCILEAVVSKEGRLTDVRWLKPEEAAPEAKAAITGELLSWRFVPALSEGRPVAAYYSLSLHHCPCIRKPIAV